MNNYPVLLKKEIMELARSYKLLIGLTVFSFFGIMSPVLAKYMPQILKMAMAGQSIEITIQDVNIQEAYNQFVKNISQMGIFLCIPLAMGAVAKEKDKGCLIFLLTKPVPRGIYLGAKFSAYGIFLIICLASSALLFSLYSYILFEEFAASAVTGLTLLLLLYCLTFTFITIFFSTVFSSQGAVAGISFGAWILFTLLAVLEKIGRYSPGYLLKEALAIQKGFPMYTEPVIGSLVIVCASVVAAVLLFRKWEPK